MEKLLKASATASTNQVQHILFTLNSDGKVNFGGTDNIVTPFVGNTELFNHIKTVMKDNLTKEHVTQLNTHQLDYEFLPCSPFSPKWKGSAKIRGILRNMLNTAGYGSEGNKRKLGVDPAPVGWPAAISWTNFRGSTRSKLTVEEVTTIIVSMLEGAGIDPNIHVRNEEEEVADEINDVNIANIDNTAEDEDFEIDVLTENDERENNVNEEQTIAVGNTVENYTVIEDNHLENEQVMKDKNEYEDQDKTTGFKRKIGSV